MKDHADYWTEEQIKTDLKRIAKEVRTGKKDEFEQERDAYFSDPANAGEIEEMFARMELVEAMYKARHEAGLSQKEIAKRMGTKQSYIAAVERGRKNITFATLSKYAKACGKRIVLL